MDTELIIASRDGDLEKVKELLEKGASVNKRGEEMSRNSLMHAVVNGHLEVVKVLIAYGADINMKDGIDWTPLMMGVLKGNSSIVNLLIEKGAKLEEKNGGGVTALRLAAFHDRFSIAKILLNAGADPSNEDSNLDSPVRMALQKSIRIAYLFEKHKDILSRNDKILMKRLPRRVHFQKESV